MPPHASDLSSAIPLAQAMLVLVAAHPQLGNAALCNILLVLLALLVIWIMLAISPASLLPGLSD